MQIDKQMSPMNHSNTSSPSSPYMRRLHAVVPASLSNNLKYMIRRQAPFVTIIIAVLQLAVIIPLAIQNRENITLPLLELPIDVLISAGAFQREGYEYWRVVTAGLVQSSVLVAFLTSLNQGLFFV